MQITRRHVLSIPLGLAFAASHVAPAQEVQRSDVRAGGLVGRFYAAAGASKRTGVLMLTGSGGGYPDEASARDLARAGYPVFAVAYFRDRDGNPPELQQTQLSNVPLEYLFKALEWLEARPEVRADHVAVMGESRGAELALLVGSLRPDVAAVIAYSPTTLRWGAVGAAGGAWTLHGVPLAYAQTHYDRTAPMRQWTDVLDGPVDARRAAAIEVEHIHGPLLLLSSKADAMWPAARMADSIEARLRANGFKYRVVNVQYDDASHLLMGFGPAITELKVYEPGTTRLRFTMHFGGSAAGTEAARNAGWQHVKQFLAGL
jgi:dienelactone hydrolase